MQPAQPLVVADALVERSEEVAREQRADEANAPDSYAEALPIYVGEKIAQVDRIEEQLEGMMTLQQDAIAEHSAHQPGFLSLPSTRQAWATQHLQLQTRLEGLQARLEVVHDIRDSMGAQVSRLEELATKKLRFQRPELAEEWDSLREEARRNHLLNERAQSRGRDEENRSRGLSLVQSIARRPD